MFSLIEIPWTVTLKLIQGSIQPGFSGGAFFFQISANQIALTPWQ